MAGYRKRVTSKAAEVPTILFVGFGESDSMGELARIVQRETRNDEMKSGFNCINYRSAEDALEYLRNQKRLGKPVESVVVKSMLPLKSQDGLVYESAVAKLHETQMEATNPETRSSRSPQETEGLKAEIDNHLQKANSVLREDGGKQFLDRCKEAGLLVETLSICGIENISHRPTLEQHAHQFGSQWAKTFTAPVNNFDLVDAATKKVKAQLAAQAAR